MTAVVLPPRAGSGEKKGLMYMKIRKDSPFFGMTEEDMDLLLEEAENNTADRVADWWVVQSGKEVATEQMRRFLVRLRRHRMLFAGTEEEEGSGEELEKFAGRAADGKMRDGLIEAARQRLFEEALEKGDSAALLELYKAANEERAREREVEVERRKAAVAEENARIGWVKALAVAGPAQRRALAGKVVSSELALAGNEKHGKDQKGESDASTGTRLLPFLRGVLEEEGLSAEEKLARVRAVVDLKVSAVGLLEAPVSAANEGNDKIQGHK
jgi:hypothetical protein